MFFSILFLFLLLLLMLPIWTLNSVLMSISFHRRTKINHAKENQPNWIYFISQTYYSLHTHTHISIRFNFSVIFFVIDYTHFISLSSGEKDEKKNTCLFWKFESIIDSILRKNSFNNQNGFFFASLTDCDLTNSIFKCWIPTTVNIFTKISWKCTNKP